LNLAGRTEKVAFTTLPSWSVAAPTVPAWLETTNGAANCQHSRVEAPLDAEMAVRLRYVKVPEVKVKRWTRRVRKRRCMLAGIDWSGLGTRTEFSLRKTARKRSIGGEEMQVIKRWKSRYAGYSNSSEVVWLVLHLKEGGDDRTPNQKDRTPPSALAPNINDPAPPT